jgi:hypothetical protein
MSHVTGGMVEIQDPDTFPGIKPVELTVEHVVDILLLTLQ